uniref:Outer dense fiber protein 2 n=1 Tax=Poecilia reticulata TaxID=8081 RepID=A0A3P9NGH8_POERE
MRNLSGSPRVQVHVSNAEGLYLHVRRTSPSETSQVRGRPSAPRPVLEPTEASPLTRLVCHFLCGEVTSCGPRVPSPDPFPKDPELLLQKLREAEADAAAAAKQVHALKEHVCKLGDSTPMWAGLDQQKELLLHKLEAFEVTNRALRHLLREQRESQVRRPDSELSLLVKKLQEKEKELHQLSTQLDSEKENARRSSDLSRNLDATRARLQGQLRSKEAENNRLVVQIKNLERTANQQLAEADQVAQQLGRAKQEAQEEQEALKRVSQAQKKRMELCEGTAGQLTAQLLQRVGPTWPHGGRLHLDLIHLDLSSGSAGHGLYLPTRHCEKMDAAQNPVKNPEVCVSPHLLRLSRSNGGTSDLPRLREPTCHHASSSHPDSYFTFV